MAFRDPAFNEDELYDQFPAGASEGFGPREGFNTWIRVNDASLFTAEALADPAIRAFVEAPFAVTFAQFKSSHRESEYFVHKPHLAMTGQVDGIEGAVEGLSGDDPRTPIATLVFNHERTLARLITRSIVISDGGVAGQIIAKQQAT
ncbi:MAG TPA: hypothetical protein VER83_03880 [Candidatus Nanopelagicales bacterium]|nr:hypothetical protein [Candidatus Nanopelagicales bacterium]